MNRSDALARIFEIEDDLIDLRIALARAEERTDAFQYMTIATKIEDLTKEKAALGSLV